MAPERQTVRTQRRLNEVDEAARRVIVRKGLRSTTMRDISREGGFTTGVLTHYFPDKDALIVGVFSSASQSWIEGVRASLAEAATAQERLAVIVELAIPADPDERREWRLWAEMWSYAGWNTSFAEHIIETDALWEQELGGVLKQAIGERLLPKLDVAAQARILARLIDGLGLRSLLSGRWDEARATLVAHLAAIGLDPGTVRALESLAQPA
ncbi:MAG TPA: TetR/AcrR family transcriptional regulator [Solirubrobacteraceae bacterium]